MKSKIHKKYCIFDPEDNAGGQRSTKAYKKWRKRANNKKVRRLKEQNNES